MATSLCRSLRALSLSRPPANSSGPLSSSIVSQNGGACRSLSTILSGRTSGASSLHPSLTPASASVSFQQQPPMHQHPMHLASSPSQHQSQLQQTRTFAGRSADTSKINVEAELNATKPGAPKLCSDQIPPAFLRPLPKKPAPSVVRKRVDRLRTYSAQEKDIRHSPWRMNLVCQFAAGQTVPEALTQLQYVRKVHAPTVKKVIEKAVKDATDQDGLHPTQLEVAECFSTHGKPLKRMKIMGRGRAGVMHRRYAHINVKLREIDFPLKIALSRTVNGKKKWLQRMKMAEREGEQARAKKEEIEELERQIKEQKKAREAAEKQ